MPKQNRSKSLTTMNQVVTTIKKGLATSRFSYLILSGKIKIAGIRLLL